MPCGPECACDPGVECLSVVAPETFGFFKDWCASGDPAKRLHVRNRSAIGYTPPDPAVVVVSVPAPIAATRPRSVLDNLPLAGDAVEAVAKRIGADKLARWWERATGVPCGCPERQAKLNRATERLQRFARRLGV